MNDDQSWTDRGCYGLRLSGIRFDPRWTLPAPPGSAELNVRVTAVDAPNPEGTSEVVELLGGARMCVNADASRATFHADPQPTPVDLVHPWLAPAAARRSLALGRLTLHGGLINANGAAVAVVGHREAGKSTVVAHAALSGLDVMTDDIIVWSEGRVFAGPRCVDLREGTAAHVGGHRLSSSREGTRRRLALGPTVWDAPLAAIVVLAWAETTSLQRVGPSERLAELQEHLACAMTTQARLSLLALAATPVWRLSRPYDFGQLDATVRSVAELSVP